jgi:hypothetical protein
VFGANMHPHQMRRRRPVHSYQNVTISIARRIASIPAMRVEQADPWSGSDTSWKPTTQGIFLPSGLILTVIIRKEAQ